MLGMGGFSPLPALFSKEDMVYVYSDCPDCGAPVIDVARTEIEHHSKGPMSIYDGPEELVDFWQYCENQECGWTSEYSVPVKSL